MNSKNKKAPKCVSYVLLQHQMCVNDVSHACDIFFRVLLLALGCMIRSTHVYVYALRCGDATSAEELLLLRAAPHRRRSLFCFNLVIAHKSMPVSVGESPDD